jgi:hypothetical protein
LKLESSLRLEDLKQFSHGEVAHQPILNLSFTQHFTSNL